MYNFQFIVLPKSTVVFVDNKSQIQIKNITTQQLGYKIRTTNNVDYKVMDSKGIIMPQEIKIIRIQCVSHTKTERVKFQIITTLLNSNDTLDSAFTHAEPEQIQKVILKGRLDDSISEISNSAIQQDQFQFVQEQSGQLADTIKIPNYHQNNENQNQSQFSAFHIFFVGVICLFLGYLTHYLQCIRTQQ